MDGSKERRCLPSFPHELKLELFQTIVTQCWESSVDTGCFLSPIRHICLLVHVNKMCFLFQSSIEVLGKFYQES